MRPILIVILILEIRQVEDEDDDEDDDDFAVTEIARAAFWLRTRG